MSTRYSVFCKDENAIIHGFTSGGPLTRCPNSIDHAIDETSVRLISNDAIYLAPPSSADTVQNRKLVCSEQTLIDLSPTRGLSVIRDRVTGTGTVTSDGVSFKLVVQGSTDEVTLRSAQRGRFVMGLTSTAAIGGWVEGALIGNQCARFGLFDATDGFFFELKQMSFQLVILKGGSGISRIDRTLFNGDRLDGTGPSGVILDPTRGYVFVVRYTGYSVSFYVRTTHEKNGKISDILLHTYQSETSALLNHNNLPITALLHNAGTSANAAIHVTGRSYGVFGKYKNTMYRSVGAFIYNKNPTTPPAGARAYALMSIRVKPDFITIPITIESVDTTSKNTLRTTILQLISGGTLDNPSWRSPQSTDPSETAMEMDSNARYVTGGTVVWQAFIRDGYTKGQQTGIDFHMLEDEILTVGLLQLESINSISASIKWMEEW